MVGGFDEDCRNRVAKTHWQKSIVDESRIYEPGMEKETRQDK